MNLLIDIPETNIPKKNLVNISIRISKSQKDFLDKLSQDHNSSNSMIMRLLLNTFIEQLKEYQVEWDNE